MLFCVVPCTKRKHNSCRKIADFALKGKSYMYRSGIAFTGLIFSLNDFYIDTHTVTI